ncbi:hypothetical protein BKA82DRAFT_164893 [Pisolithus tinctorius]|uniref:Aminoglycoside phosphotransferase domain-containing protein n=1 Tax=Pisolithus tinctorius Marx 270 TaxID=870435 RepID=A0A0C3NKD0_PISTI|nr:hypothetical protein BKA82DRAFT_164893 [Pisolithus tinctorius]KIN95788.1 hypothetical protein M404DRAFT_164893 [Pisolithus tinctorius Marx 270]
MGQGSAVPDFVFIFIERASGESLDIQTWLSLDGLARDRIIVQLHNYILQIRALKLPAGTLIGSVTSQPGWPADEQAGVSGPYADEADMNLALRRQHDISEFPPNVVESLSRSYSLVYIHGDIDLRNAMVKDDKVVALIDWEATGWFLAHWKYLKAH